MDITFHPAEIYRHRTHKFVDMETNLVYDNSTDSSYTVAFAWNYLLNNETEFADRAERIVKIYLRYIKKTTMLQKIITEPEIVIRASYSHYGRDASLMRSLVIPSSFFALSTARHPFTDKVMNDLLPRIYFRDGQDLRSFLKHISVEYGREQLILWLEKLGATAINICPENVIVIVTHKDDSPLADLSFPFPTRLGINVQAKEGHIVSGRHTVRNGTPRPEDIVRTTTDYLRDVNRVIAQEGTIPMGSRVQVRIDGARRLQENEI